LWDAIPIPRDGVWVDMGGGTGHNLGHFGDRICELRKVYLVDLSPSLLAIAAERVRQQGWSNVEAVQADVTTFQPTDGPADVVTFSYSLTMIPDWFAALEHARSLLRPGGVIGVVDFYVSRKYPAAGLRRHSWWTRTFWPAWFVRDNVLLSADHLPFLSWRFQTVRLDERRARVPYVPLARVPYYIFVGHAPRGELVNSR
jgi:S-adenosylmethionine-diacylgycerolhomoserine-N-methlytransferase